MFKHFAAMSIGMLLVALILNLAFFGGLIYFGLWALQHFGII